MRMLLPAVALAASLAVLAVGCGDSTAEACVITPSGNKLCAKDAAAFCRGFVGDTLDADTVRACGSVGVDVVPDTPEAAGADALVAQCVELGGKPRECDGIRRTAYSDVLPELTVDMRSCIRGGGVPRYCVSDSR